MKIKEKRNSFMRSTYLFLFVSFLFISCKSSITNIPGGTTTINYSIPVESSVKLTLENSYNTVVRMLVDEIQNSGFYSVTFNNSDFPEGIYFYTLVARGVHDNSYFEGTKHTILIKR
jgi:hypothetical protein